MYSSLDNCHRHPPARLLASVAGPAFNGCLLGTRTRELAVYRVDIARADATLVASFTGTVYISSRAKHALPGHH